MHRWAAATTQVCFVSIARSYYYAPRLTRVTSIFLERHVTHLIIAAFVVVLISSEVTPVTIRGLSSYYNLENEGITGSKVDAFQQQF